VASVVHSDAPTASTATAGSGVEAPSGVPGPSLEVPGKELSLIGLGLEAATFEFVGEMESGWCPVGGDVA